jgi:hypothetical protein
MFVRWLFTVFPREMRQGWELVRKDLFVWLWVAVLSTLATLSAPATGGSPLTLLVSVPLLLLLVATVVMKFDAAARQTTVSWGEIGSRFLSRVPALFAAASLSVAISIGLAILARAAALILLRDTALLELAPSALGVVVYISLLVRFSFVPFLVVLDRANDIAAITNVRWLGPLVGWLWPLVASARMTERLGWKLSPYMILLHVGSAIALLPPVSRPVVLVAWQLVQLTAQAVLFGYYKERRAAVAAGSPLGEPGGRSVS